MSSIFSWGPNAPYVPVYEIQPGLFSPLEARRAAFAFAIGAHRPSANPPPPRAPRRGELPDVDFSQAVRVPRRSLWSRIAAAFRAPSSEVLTSEEINLETPPMSQLVTAAGDNVIRFRHAA